MRIDQKPTLFGTAATGQVQRREAPGPRFSVGGRDGSTASRAVASSAPLATMDAILALQGEGDPAERRRRALKRGHTLLDALDRLKAALLGGRIAASDLSGLAAELARAGEASGDPRLDDLIAHIELRAQVEMAKWAAG